MGCFVSSGKFYSSLISKSNIDGGASCFTLRGTMFSVSSYIGNAILSAGDDNPEEFFVTAPDFRAALN